jgi:hypothetical protein
MISYGDTEGKATVQAECDKRNKHKGRTNAHMMWKCLFSSEKGWHCAYRPAVEVQVKPKGKLS